MGSNTLQHPMFGALPAEPAGASGHRSRLLLLAWVAALVAGVAALQVFVSLPGREGPAPGAWPSASRIERAPDRACLVLFLDPDCPCSRATLSELDRLLAQTGTAVQTEILFVIPEGGPESAGDGRLLRQAAGVAGARVRLDRGGREARLFGALTSGQVLFYSAANLLQFTGGLTASRGHEGESVGRGMILWAVGHPGAAARHAPTFGCALFDDAASAPAPGGKGGRPAP